MKISSHNAEAFQPISTPTFPDTGTDAQASDYEPAATIASRLGVSTRTVRRLGRSRLVPTLRVGRLVRFRFSEVVRCLRPV